MTKADISLVVDFECPVKIGEVIVNGDDTDVRTCDRKEISDGFLDTSISH